MDLNKIIVLEVADIIDARELDHTLPNRFAVLTELQAARLDMLVYSHEYLKTLTQAIIFTALDIRELV